MASGVAVVLGIVLGLAKIVPTAPAGGVVAAVGCTVFQMWHDNVAWALQARVLHIYVRQR
jgi:hypothetical protein